LEWHPAVFVRVASKELTGYGTLKSVGKTGGKGCGGGPTGKRIARLNKKAKRFAVNNRK
jgi:hypothetical protein